jgi:SAM-dependent methyltransferase
MFSAGDAYERFMGRWSRALAPQLVQFSRVRDGDAVLDVGSGTGALAEAIAAVTPSRLIVGIDQSTPYVTRAQQRHRAGRIRFAVGDARHLPFAGDTFDRTLSLLILNFVPDPAGAVTEMSRVTRPGGTISAAVWDYGGAMEMLRVFWEEAIDLDAGAADRDERRMPLCRRGELAALWRANELQDVIEEPLTIRMEFVSFDDYWLPFQEQQGPAGAYVATLGQDGRERLRLRLRSRLVADGADRPFVLSARAWAVRGRLGARN